MRLPFSFVDELLSFVEFKVHELMESLAFHCDSLIAQSNHLRLQNGAFRAERARIRTAFRALYCLFSFDKSVRLHFRKQRHPLLAIFFQLVLVSLVAFSELIH